MSASPEPSPELIAEIVTEMIQRGVTARQTEKFQASVQSFTDALQGLANDAYNRYIDEQAEKRPDAPYPFY